MKIILTFCLLAGMANAETFTGVVTETMCGAKPHTMFKGRSNAECVRLCVKGPYGYALWDGTNVMKLSDQKGPPSFAGQRVKVTGTLDEKNRTIKVTSIAALETN